MIRATTHAQFVKTPSPPIASDGRGLGQNENHKPAYGPALLTGAMQRHDGGVQLLIQREVLASKIAHALSLRRSKEASGFEAELRALNHSILKQGPRKC